MDNTIHIPGYLIEKHIGSGAMATVYLAIQQSLERKVALKLMASAMLADATFCERFLKEGKIIAQLNHPNIITIYDIGLVQNTNTYYMAMEYVDGGHTLKELIEQGIDPERAVDILRQMAAALGYAHRHGFMHRDVKPANILLRRDGSPVLSDFGIAKAFDGTQMTAAGAAIGTPSYMSPEQIRGADVDARADLYSLGVVFYEMLTGRKPFQGDSIPTVLWKHVNDPPPPLPAELSAYQGIIDHLLAKEPADRFLDAQALIQTLRQLDPTTATGHGDRSEWSTTGAAETTEVSPNATLTQASASGVAASQTDGNEHAFNRSWLWALLLVPLAGGGIYLLPQDTLTAFFTTTERTPNPQVERAPLDERTQREIEGHLRTAAAHFENGFLTDYDLPISNATYSYQRVLELDPYNEEAKRGLKKVADTYAELVRERIDRNDLDGALALTEAGLTAMPNHAELLQLRSKINELRQNR